MGAKMLFQALRASRMLAAQKTTTGIVGLEVVPQARPEADV